MAKATVSNGKDIDAATADLTAQIDQIKDDISALTRIMGDLGRAQGQAASARVEETVQELRSAGEKQLETARVQADHMGKAANDFVTQQPAAALGIAAGVGFLVGMLGTRK